jgi:hypothetical protein
MRSLGSLFLLLALTSFGCSPKVVVTDTAGKPVQGAAVTLVSPSMNSAATLTDANGEAPVPLSNSVQEIKWVSIKKAGYDPVQVDVPAQWPLRVTLAPAGTAKLGVQLTTQP